MRAPRALRRQGAINSTRRNIASGQARLERLTGGSSGNS